MSGVALHLLRHGAPERTGALLGHLDLASTPDGNAACQAQTTGLELARIVSSDLRRAADAAAIIAQGRGLQPEADARWREMDFGAWDGLMPQSVGTEALAAFWRDPDANAPPGGERWSALCTRIGAAMAALPAVPTLVVTHGGAMRAALAVLCGFGVAQAWAIDLPYAALLSLRVWPGEGAQVTGLVT